jgi:hypothetical protein
LQDNYVSVSLSLGSAFGSKTFAEVRFFRLKIGCRQQVKKFKKIRKISITFWWQHFREYGQKVVCGHGT